MIVGIQKKSTKFYTEKDSNNTGVGEGFGDQSETDEKIIKETLLEDSETKQLDASHAVDHETWENYFIRKNKPNGIKIFP